jgi:hypothetical protein
MGIMKRVLAGLKETENIGNYDVPHEEWEKLKNLITFATKKLNEEKECGRYAKLLFQEAEAGIRKRRSYIANGFVYVGIESMIEIVLGNYEQFLHKKLIKSKSYLQNLLIEDT